MKSARNFLLFTGIVRGWRRLLLALVEFTASYRRSFWAIFVLTISFLLYANSQYAHGGSWAGLIFGSIGLFMIFILMYYGRRKRSYNNPVGKLEVWLRSHMCLGTSVLFTILFHSGFRLHDPLAVTAFALLILVFLSGIVGAALYATIPPRLINLESNLTSAEISDRINDLAGSMRRLASGKSVAFQGVCHALITREWPSPTAGWRVLLPAYRNKRAAQDELRHYETDMARIEPQEQAHLTHLFELSRQMKVLHDRLVRKQAYINLMAVWLYVHVPLSVVMTIAISVHIIVALYYL